MRPSKLREAGPFAIETFTKLAPEGDHHGIGKYFSAEVVTVYADTDQPSHSVKLWKWEE